MIRRILDHWWPAAIVDRAGLGRFVAAEASYLAQRSTYEFTRNTLAWYGQAAFADDAFTAAFRSCRWESFASILSGFVVLARTHLGPEAGAGARRLDEALTALFRAELARYPVPAHRADWDDLTLELTTQLDAAADRPPSLIEIARRAAKRVQETVPVRSVSPSEDREVLANAIRFGTVGVNDRLAARLRPALVVADLLAGR